MEEELGVCETVSQFFNNALTVHALYCVLGLNYSVCEKKMQLLTLVSLSVHCKEVPFSTLTRELQLEPSKMEQLVIDGTCLVLLLFCLW